MFKLPELKTDFIEKLFRIRYFLLLLSLVLFVDTYLLAFHQTTITQVDETWFKRHATLAESLRALSCLSFFYAMLVPILQFLRDMAIGRWLEDPSYANGLVPVSEARNFAIRTGNALAYQECEKILTQANEVDELDAFCVSILALILIGHCFGTDIHPSLASSLKDSVEQLPWYQHILAMIPITAFGLLVIVLGLRPGRSYRHYIDRKTLEAWGKEPQSKLRPTEDPHNFLSSSLDVPNSIP